MEYHYGHCICVRTESATLTLVLYTDLCHGKPLSMHMGGGGGGGGGRVVAHAQRVPHSPWSSILIYATVSPSQCTWGGGGGGGGGGCCTCTESATLTLVLYTDLCHGKPLSMHMGGGGCCTCTESATLTLVLIY